MKNILICKLGLMTRYAVAIAVTCAAVHQSSASADEGDSSRNRYLLLDSRIIDSAENARLVPGTVQKNKNNPLFVEDRPWEKRFDNLYVGITRTRGPLGREVTRIESSDFVNWVSSGVVMKGLEKRLQPYAMPVFRHGGVYLGLVAIHAQRPVDRVWTELAWSPDSKQWHRISPGRALIPCSEKVLAYDYGCVYACAYPVFLDNEIRLYYGGSDYHHFGWRTGNLSLATLRPDGFAGYEQESKDMPAIIMTTSIPYRSQECRVTADVERGGSIKVSIVDGKGQQLATAQTVSKTVTDGRLKWNNKVNADMIRLRFEIDKAKIYSFSFAG